MSCARARTGDEGFALALVVLLLFAVGVLGATGYQLAVLSSALSTQAQEGQRALSIARAGLQRYIGDQIGTPADTATYAINGGDAVVTSRWVAAISDNEALYVISSEGVYLDPRSSGAAARRTVHQYAKRRAAALDFDAALTMASGSVIVQNGGEVVGRDQAGAGACSQSSADIAGLVFGTGVASWNGSDLQGNPDTVRVGSYQAVLNSLGLSWDVLTDPSFTPDFENTWPLSSVPADSFPVVRFTGDVDAWGFFSGRGVLIVQGALKPMWGFTWDGIVLVEKLTPLTSGWSFQKRYSLQGVVVAGLDDLGSTLTVTNPASIEYDRCHAFNAGNSIAYFRPIDEAWWEDPN